MCAGSFWKKPVSMPAELAAEPGCSLVRDGGYIALVKTLKARQSAQELRDSGHASYRK